jgi:hypothetical protein
VGLATPYVRYFLFSFFLKYMRVTFPLRCINAVPFGKEFVFHQGENRRVSW